MKNYASTLKFLYDLQLFGIKVGLKNIRHLLRFLGNPQNRFPSIHIAGTNGKGSTAAMLASILTVAGYRTGLYTSPHLVSFNERIRIDGKKISDNDLVRYTTVLKRQIEKTGATFFEATTAIAFQYFADSHVDVAVIETGLGGRLDATNCITPILSVITNIGLEHTEYLGKTYRKIAFEKGGIIKAGVPCVIGAEIPGVIDVLSAIAKAKNSRLLHASNLSSVEISRYSLGGMEVHLETSNDVYKNLVVSLNGEYQSRNLRVCVVAAELLEKSRAFPRVTSRTVREGLASVREHTGLRGRLDVIQQSPPVIADVAHNPDGASALMATLRKLIVGKVVMVFGVMKDKEFGKMLDVMTPLVRITVAVKPENERALGSRTIVQNRHGQGFNAIDGGSVADGVKIALNEVRSGEIMLITGSHYVVGEAMKFLNLGV